MAFTFKWEKSGDRNVLFLSGVIDENVDFNKIGDESSQGKVVIDLAGIHGLNSIGLKEWIKWIRNFQGRLTLRDCSVSVVYHMNILAGFLPEKTHVESIEVPYICGECGHEESVMTPIPLAAQVSQFEAPEEIKCSKCGSPSQLDAVPDLYFQFLKRLK